MDPAEHFRRRRVDDPGAGPARLCFTASASHVCEGADAPGFGVIPPKRSPSTRPGSQNGLGGHTTTLAAGSRPGCTLYARRGRPPARPPWGLLATLAMAAVVALVVPVFSQNADAGGAQQTLPACAGPDSDSDRCTAWSGNGLCVDDFYRDHVRASCPMACGVCSPPLASREHTALTALKLGADSESVSGTEEPEDTSTDSEGAERFMPGQSGAGSGAGSADAASGAGPHPIAEPPLRGGDGGGWWGSGVFDETQPELRSGGGTAQTDSPSAAAAADPPYCDVLLTTATCDDDGVRDYCPFTCGPTTAVLREIEATTTLPPEVVVLLPTYPTPLPRTGAFSVTVAYTTAMQGDCHVAIFVRREERGGGLVSVTAPITAATGTGTPCAPCIPSLIAHQGRAHTQEGVPIVPPPPRVCPTQCLLTGALPFFPPKNQHTKPLFLMLLAALYLVTARVQNGRHGQTRDRFDALYDPAK